jgi:3-oxoacyl-[acyl-carrier-protein] synthase III
MRFFSTGGSDIMDGVGIKAASFFFPDKRQKTDTLEEYASLCSEEEIYRITFNNTGIKYIREAGLMDATELAIAAASDLFKTSNIDRGDIDCVVYLQGRSPTYLMSSELTRLTNVLSIENAFSISLTDLGCVDISSALIIAKQFIESGAYKNILICYGSRPVAQKRFRFPVTVLGDGGMAILVSSSPTNKLIDYKLTTNGKHWDLYSVDYKNLPYEKWHETCKNLGQYSFELALESKKKFEQMNQEILQEHHITYDQINYFLMQNISKGAFDFYEEAFDISFAKVCRSNLLNFGHLGPMDIILNYFSLLETQKCCKGDKVLVMNNSPVAAWSSLLFEV